MVMVPYLVVVMICLCMYQKMTTPIMSQTWLVCLLMIVHSPASRCNLALAFKDCCYYCLEAIIHSN
jgi:hypothetical protein